MVMAQQLTSHTVVRHAETTHEPLVLLALFDIVLRCTYKLFAETAGNIRRNFFYRDYGVFQAPRLLVNVDAYGK